MGAFDASLLALAALSLARAAAWEEMGTRREGRKEVSSSQREATERGRALDSLFPTSERVPREVRAGPMESDVRRPVDQKVNCEMLGEGRGKKPGEVSLDEFELRFVFSSPSSPSLLLSLQISSIPS